jgi:hypothetical protein
MGQAAQAAVDRASSRQRALAPNHACGRDARLVADAHELGDRPYPHLLHYPPTVHLDRLFRGSEIRRDLLIQAASDHMFENLALARRQGCEPALDRGKPSTNFPCLDVLLESEANGVEQLFSLHGLHQETDGAGAHCAHAHRDIAASREEDDRPFAPGIRQQLLELEAVHSINGDVENGAAGYRGIVLFQERSRRKKAPDLISRGPQQTLQGSDHGRLIIDEEYGV